MIYTEMEIYKLMKAKDLTVEEEIKYDIFNFIRMIKLNKKKFITASFDSEYFGKLPMTFRKKEGQVMGLVTATVNGEVRKYLFNDEGYEPLDDLLELLNAIN
ncbi:hypothetical protein SAMN04488102_10339 [Alkalibacterium subtropicum]|uniref:Uncharacterized protein n=1 Tax=Alkalibacterium subtropicum TaxID=753702 RepID=A0A1I1GDZ4_9LACT|nr:hypothetical protein [Alkalibacterium subtropicum]SFC09997.1 hypothetical protein SAMN04488102_10339 [Alkalibacterium subtropicum]